MQNRDSESQRREPMNTSATAPKAPARLRVEGDIMDAARRLFAQHGYGGVSLDTIASEAGVSKQGLLYYFPKKVVLYRAVLQNVLDVWLEYMDVLGHRDDDPETALRAYISGKLRFSREHPHGSRVFASEVIAGAPHFADEIERRVVPALHADEQVYRHWVERGLCRPMDTRHLMVVLWAATQAYADFASQICLILGKPELEQQDFDDAEKVIVEMVLRSVLRNPGD